MVFFNPIVSVWMVLVALVLVTSILLMMEWVRKLRYTALRLSAVVLLGLALAGLFLRPGYYSSQSSEIILLTPGYQPAVVDSLLRQNPSAKLMHLQQAKPYRNSELLESYSQLHFNHNEIRYVVGQGLPVHALDAIKKKGFVFMASEPPDGIVEIAVSQPVYPHQDNFVSGVFKNPPPETWILLDGPGGVEDSVFLEDSGYSHFKLSFKPKQEGHILYSISTKTKGTLSLPEKLPIHVCQPDTLSILFVRDYPTFETQYLKNFLAKQHHKLTLRYRLSQSMYQFEYANTGFRPVNNLSPEILGQFDVLVIDGESLQRLSKSEAAAVDESINKGLGILVLSPTNRIDTRLFPFAQSVVKTDTAVTTINNKSLNLPALAQRVKKEPGVTSVIENQSGLLSGYRYKGFGKIGFQFLKETYRLILSGDSVAYSHIWMPLLNGISRAKNYDGKIIVESPFPVYPDNPVSVKLISRDDDVQLEVDSISWPLQEDVIIDNVWSAKLWAGEPGWHSLATASGNKEFYYVSAPGEWQSVALTNQIKANIWESSNKEENGRQDDLVRKEFNPLIFFLLFLLSAGFLWLVPKL
ncbi:MAG: hypothetical protein KF725_05595 [Cyclobacteriaceae bacterium]|nr:hypothetical protein [Cyclobacteriaceae bacterium]UYN85948.1 MAG: hypothetical protein KIT51_13875 [Cyclobacteriaceae bacterium]